MKISTTTKVMISIGFYLFVAVGASLIVKANVGMDCFYGFVTAVSAITHIKIGTITAIVNAVFVLAYILLTKGKNIPVYIIQIISLTVFGTVVNLLLYNVFNNIEITNYVLRVVMLVSGVVISAISIGVVTVLHIITFPIEATCYQMDKMKIVVFVKMRYGIDTFFLVSSLLITWIFSTGYFIREGTLMAILIFSFVLNLTKSFMHRHFVIHDAVLKS